MNVTSITPRKRTAVLRGATALTIIATLSLGVPATVGSAQTVIGVVNSQAVTDIDSSRLVSLTIIKTPGNPYDDESGQLPPIQGVTFTVQRVQGINLATEAGWETARDIELDEARERGFTHTFTAVTNADGEAYFPNLPVGLYVISETPVRVPGQPTPEIIDFMITLPTGDYDGVNWDYDVQVRAKSEEVAGSTPTPTTTPTTPGTTTTRTTTPTETVASYTPTPRTTPVTSPPRPTEQVAAYVPPRPGGPGESVASYGPGRQSLASTGADVAGIVAFALILIGGGLYLVMRNRRREQ